MPISIDQVGSEADVTEAERVKKQPRVLIKGQAPELQKIQDSKLENMSDKEFKEYQEFIKNRGKPGQ